MCTANKDNKTVLNGKLPEYPKLKNLPSKTEPVHFIILVFLLLSCSACAATASVPLGIYSEDPIPNGTMWSRYKYSLSANELEASYKKGYSMCYSFFGAIAYGDASIEAAAKKGNIKKIKHVDARVYSVAAPYLMIVVYQEFTTVVYGE